RSTSSSGDVRFNMLHKDTHNRIKMIPTDPETGPVDRADIVKGYEIEKGRYVVVTDEEIKAVRLSTTRTLDIERFVDEDEIDRLYWNDPYFLVPDGEMAVEAFTVIREAMEKAGKIALGRLVMHQRERLMALEPRDLGMVAFTIRSNREVKKAADILGDIPDVKPDAQMVDIAAKIIAQQEGPLDPSQFTDRYEEALRKLIQDKEKGGTVGAPEPPKEAEVIDLMDALRRSLGQSGATKKAPARRASGETAPPKIAAARAKAAPKTHAPAKKPPAKKAAPKRKSA